MVALATKVVFKSIRIDAEDHGREPVGESVRLFWVEIV